MKHRTLRVAIVHLKWLLEAKFPVNAPRLVRRGLLAPPSAFDLIEFFGAFSGGHNDAKAIAGKGKGKVESVDLHGKETASAVDCQDVAE